MVTRAVGSHKSNVGRGPVDNDANNNSRQGYVQRYVPADTAIINPIFVIPSWLVYSGGSPAGAQTPDTYIWQNSYSIEYPTGSGNLHQITWGGASTITTTPGTGNYTSDALQLTMAAGAAYAIRDWGQAQNLRVPTATVTVSGGSLTSAAISDGGIGLNTTAPVFGSATAPALTASVPVGAGAGSGGAIACTVAGGVLTALPLTAGSGYTNGTYPIVFTNGANMERCAYHTTGDWAQHGTGLPDLTMITTVKANDQLGFVAPMLILGTQSPPAPAIGLIADSILDGSSDQTTATSGWIGAFEKSIGRQHGKVEMPQSGQTLANYNTLHTGIAAMLLPNITHLVNGLIRNDVGIGATLLSLQTALVLSWSAYLTAGIKVYQVTCLPTTSSTDNWATTANQTITNPIESTRTALNDWLRNTAPGLYGIICIDMCSVVESYRNSGLFAAGSGGGKSGIPALTISGGVVTACAIPFGSLYPLNSAIPCQVFYPIGAPGSGLALTANTDGSGAVASVTINNGGTGQDAANPPAVGMPGQYTIDGVHPSTFGHFKMMQAGLFSPSLFTQGNSMVTTTFELGQKYKNHPTLGLFIRNNAPTNGQYNGAAPFGALVLDIVGGVLYQNTGTIDSTTFAVFGGTLPAVTSGANLPTADPHVVGRLWSNSGVVTVSAG